MDYTKSIPDIYSDSFTQDSKKIMLDIEKIYLTDDQYNHISLIHITSNNLNNITIVLIKLNIYCDMNTQPIFNKSIYFPNKKQKVIRYVPMKCDKLYDNAYIEVHKINIINIKYQIYKVDDEYCTGDDNMMIFSNDIRNYVCTFTICIKLYDPISERTYKIDKKKLQIIKLKSKNFIFSYEPILENNKLIVLYLIGITQTSLIGSSPIDKRITQTSLIGSSPVDERITQTSLIGSSPVDERITQTSLIGSSPVDERITNIKNDETIKIDIKFTDINTIYHKYEKAIDDVKHFIFEKSDKKLEDYVIKIKYIEKYIKGVYYPNVIYTKIHKN